MKLERVARRVVATDTIFEYGTNGSRIARIIEILDGETVLCMRARLAVDYYSRIGDAPVLYFNPQ